MSTWLILAYSTGENPPTSTPIFVIHIVPRKIIHLLKQFVELCLPIRLESWFHQPDLYHAYHLLNTWVKLCANFACVPVVKTQRRAVQGNWKYLWLVPTSVFSGTKRYLKSPKAKKFHYTHQSSIPTMRTHNIGVTEPYRYNFSRFLRHIKFLARLEMARTVDHE